MNKKESIDIILFKMSKLRTLLALKISVIIENKDLKSSLVVFDTSVYPSSKKDLLLPRY